MASLPDRAETLRKSLYSLLYQVDTIQIALTYEAPNWLQALCGKTNGAVYTVYHDNSLRDGSRFINADRKPGYCLVCDDDILYPPDFVQRMVKQYEALPEPGFLAPMGKVLKPRPLQSYYKGWAKNFKTFEEVKELERVDIPGCCGILWHTDLNEKTWEPLNHKSMVVPNSDVCVGVHARIGGLPCYVIPHAADWLKDLMPELPKGTLDIYNTYKKNDKVQTDHINRWM